MPIDWKMALETDEEVPRLVCVDETACWGSRRWVHLEQSLDPDNEGMWFEVDGTPLKGAPVYFPMGIRNRRAITQRCTEIADQVVPEYRNNPKGRGGYSCTSYTAQHRQAAWDGACIALGGDPAEYRK